MKESKLCKKCEQELPIELFMSDGARVYSKCMACREEEKKESDAGIYLVEIAHEATHRMNFIRDVGYVGESHNVVARMKRHISNACAIARYHLSLVSWDKEKGVIGLRKAKVKEAENLDFNMVVFSLAERMCLLGDYKQALKEFHTEVLYRLNPEAKKEFGGHGSDELEAHLKLVEKYYYFWYMIKTTLKHRKSPIYLVMNKTIPQGKDTIFEYTKYIQFNDDYTDYEFVDEELKAFLIELRDQYDLRPIPGLE